MKHTKYFILPLFAVAVLLSSCNKEELIVENESALDSGKKSSKANSFYEEGLPKIKFVPKGEGTNIYTILLNDPATTTTVSFKGRIRYNDQSSARAIEGSNDVLFTIEDFKLAGKAPKVAFPSPVENKILDVYLEYREGDVIVKSLEYSLFVFADGTTALQKPEVKISKKGLVGRWTFDDSQGQDNSSATYSVTVENDPAEIVSVVEVQFDEKTSSPAPKSFTNYLKRKAKYGQHMVFSDLISFNGNPQGSTFSVQIALLDEKGNEISQLDNGVTICQRLITGQEGSRIHALRMKESRGQNNELLYEMAALVVNINQKRLGYIDIKFIEPFVGPIPVKSNLQLKKRPDILVSEWDELLDESFLTEIQNNPLYNGEYGTEFNPLFEKSAVGFTYTVSATIFDKNNKQIGSPQILNVTVEGEIVVTEPELVSTSLYSNDGGKTWNYEAVIEDNGQSVEKVQVEFVKPDGPSPINNPISLIQVAEKEGNIKIYSGKVEFNGNPTGFVYIANIYMYKKSGGSYGDTVVARAPATGITHEYH